MATSENGLVPYAEDKKKEESQGATLDDLLAGAIENVAELAAEFENKKKNEGSETIYLMERQFEVKQGRVTTSSKGKRQYQEGDSYALGETLERLTVDGEVCNEKRSLELSARVGPPEKKAKKGKKGKKGKKAQEKKEESDEDQ